MTTTTAHPPHPPAPVLMLRLLRRLHRVAPEFSLSVGLLLGWTADEIAARNRSAAAARAVDDRLEHLRPEIEASLRNDPPALRRAVLAALDDTHARTEALAAELRIDLTPADAASLAPHS